MYTWEDHERRILGRSGLTFTRKQFVLDVGCGGSEEGVRGGRMSYLIAQQAGKVIGVDFQPNPAWHESQLKSSNLEFVVTDACKLPLRNNTFDLVFAKNLLHHVAMPELAIAEMKRVTKRGGIIIIIESNRYNPIKYIVTTKIFGHEHFTGKYFKRLLCQQFNEVKFKSFEAHYYPVKTKLGKYLLLGVERVFEKTPLLNRLLGLNVAIARNEG